MGSNTWTSLPEKSRPLKGRDNAVLCWDEFDATGGTVYGSMDEAIKAGQNNSEVETLFIIGGGMIYKEGMTREDLDGIYLTRVKGDFDCEIFIPKVPEIFSNISSMGEVTEGEIEYEYLLYEK